MLLIRRSTLEGITRTSVHDNKSWSFLRMAIVFLAEAERCTRTTLQVHVVMQVKICLSSKGDGLIPDGRCCGLFKTSVACFITIIVTTNRDCFLILMHPINTFVFSWN